MNENKRIIEINGIKMEVDLTTCKRIDEFRVGDAVKVLKKGNSYHGDTISVGTIVEFVNFQELPTIKIAIFTCDMWHSAEIEFIYFNKNTTDYEIVPAMKSDLTLEKSAVVDKFNNQIEEYKNKIQETEAKRDWFIAHYGKYFESFNEIITE